VASTSSSRAPAVCSTCTPVGAVDLSNVETLVLDEADRMLDMGFWPDVSRILGLLPRARQNLLFSATMDPQVLKIVDSILHQPGPRRGLAAHQARRPHRAVALPGRARAEDRPAREELPRVGHTRTLVFTRTKHRADRLSSPARAPG
jgi:ATP-dependent RNA helicase RhlE